MAITAQELITRAYILAGAVSSGGTPTAEELTDGLNALNEMLANWAVDNVSVPYQDVDVITLVVGDNSFTIGPTGDFVTDRPLSFQSAWIEDINDQTYPFEIIDVREYTRIAFKVDEGRPRRGWWNPTYPDGTMTMDKRAELPYRLHIVTLKQFDEFTTLSTESVLPTSYTRALRSNLCVDLGGELGAPLDPRVINMARDSLRKLKNANLERRVQGLQVDDALVNPGRYDIASDIW